MNSLEEKCTLLNQTPQVRWFDLRFKPMVFLLQKLEQEKKITVKQFKFPMLQMMNITTSVFKYDGKYYFLFISRMGKVTENFHLEKLETTIKTQAGKFIIDYPLGSILFSRIVLNSDDDPKDMAYLPMAMHSLQMDTNKLISILDKSFN